MIVILSWKNIDKNTVVVGEKNYTIAAMEYLLTRKSQQSDCMEEIFCIITIDSDEEALPSIILTTQATYPYCICDVSLPQYNTGHVYMLVYIKYFNFIYIGKMISIQNINQQQSSEFVSVST